MLSPQRLQDEHRAEVNRVHGGLVQVYPNLAVHAAPAGSGVPNAYGAYVEAIAAAAITVPFSVLGFHIDGPRAIGTNITDFVLDIGIDDGGGDVSAAEIPCTQRYSNGAGGYATSFYYPLPTPIVVPANAQVIVKVRDNRGDVQTYGVYLQTQEEDSLVVLPNLIAGRTRRILTVGPAAGAFVPITSGAGVFALGAWVQILAATAVDSVLQGINFGPGASWASADLDAQVQIGIGAGAAEVAIAEFGHMQNFGTNDGVAAFAQIMLQRPIFIPSGTRIAARSAFSANSIGTDVAISLLPLPIR